MATGKLIDIHTHGGYGVNFNTAEAADINEFARRIKTRGIVAFCPTLATDTVDNINRQLERIKLAAQCQGNNEAKILGVHLEAIFLNPLKKGIHEASLLLKPSIENYKKLKHREIIKIVTMALELDERLELSGYLKSQGVKVQLGHSTSKSLCGADGVTHLFNALPALHHREPSAILEALNDEKTYCEVIADLKHVSEDMLKLVFEVKKHDKIILVSDSLPIVHSDLKKVEFSGHIIHRDGADAHGTLGGGAMFLDEVIELLKNKNILPKNESMKMAYDNVLDYLNL